MQKANTNYYSCRSGNSMDLRDQDKYMAMEAGDLGRAYVPFYHDSKRGGK